MTEESRQYGFGVELELGFAEAVEAVTAALKSEGFGVLTTIDVQQTLKQKIDVDFEPYTILGACNPDLAHRALLVEHALGLLLPCNVVVHAHAAGTRVDAVDPIAMLGFTGNPELQSIAAEAAERLQRALNSLR